MISQRLIRDATTGDAMAEARSNSGESLGRGKHGESHEDEGGMRKRMTGKARKRSNAMVYKRRVQTKGREETEQEGRGRGRGKGKAEAGAGSQSNYKILRTI